MLWSFRITNYKVYFWTHMLEIEINDFAYKLTPIQRKKFYEVFPNAKTCGSHPKYFKDKYREQNLKNFIIEIIATTPLLKDNIVISEL